MIIKIRDLGEEQWSRAARLASQFLKEFPEKFGIRDGCIYATLRSEDPALYVYKTKTQIVVRPTKNAN